MAIPTTTELTNLWNTELKSRVSSGDINPGNTRDNMVRLLAMINGIKSSDLTALEGNQKNWYEAQISNIKAAFSKYFDTTALKDYGTDRWIEPDSAGVPKAVPVPTTTYQAPKPTPEKETEITTPETTKTEPVIQPQAPSQEQINQTPQTKGVEPGQASPIRVINAQLQQEGLTFDDLPSDLQSLYNQLLMGGEYNPQLMMGISAFAAQRGQTPTPTPTPEPTPTPDDQTPPTPANWYNQSAYQNARMGANWSDSLLGKLNFIRDWTSNYDQVHAPQGQNIAAGVDYSKLPTAAGGEETGALAGQTGGDTATRIQRLKQAAGYQAPVPKGAIDLKPSSTEGTAPSALQTYAGRQTPQANINIPAYTPSQQSPSDLQTYGARQISQNQIHVPSLPEGQTVDVSMLQERQPPGTYNLERPASSGAQQTGGRDLAVAQLGMEQPQAQVDMGATGRYPQTPTPQYGAIPQADINIHAPTDTGIVQATEPNSPLAIINAQLTSEGISVYSLPQNLQALYTQLAGGGNYDPQLMTGIASFVTQNPQLRGTAQPQQTALPTYRDLTPAAINRGQYASNIPTPTPQYGAIQPTNLNRNVPTPNDISYQGVYGATPENLIQNRRKFQYTR